MKLLFATLLMVFGPAAFGAWNLDPTRSQISFVSIKAQSVAEVHRFTEVSGRISADGIATLTIQLASVDTLIPIRDQRMRETLFRTDLFPTATVLTSLDLKALDSLAPGSTLEIATEVVLNFQDRELPFTAELLVSRLSARRVVAATLKPIIVNAANLGLTDGIEALREVAGLPSISSAVPVSVVLTFNRAP
ncbi:MAG: YceI family protein [Pseudomonadales bacterium]